MPDPNDNDFYDVETLVGILMTGFIAVSSSLPTLYRPELD